MPSGHTDTKTINQRRPLTENMKGVLQLLRAAFEKTPAGSVAAGSLSTAEGNAMRALVDRRLATWDVTVRGWRITDAGRVAAQGGE